MNEHLKVTHLLKRAHLNAIGMYWGFFSNWKSTIYYVHEMRVRVPQNLLPFSCSLLGIFWLDVWNVHSKKWNHSDNSLLAPDFNEIAQEESSYLKHSCWLPISHFSLTIIPVFKVGIVFIIFVWSWVSLHFSLWSYHIVYKHFISVTENKWNPRLSMKCHDEMDGPKIYI